MAAVTHVGEGYLNPPMATFPVRSLAAGHLAIFIAIFNGAVAANSYRVQPSFRSISKFEVYWLIFSQFFALHPGQSWARWRHRFDASAFLASRRQVAKERT